MSVRLPHSVGQALGQRRFEQAIILADVLIRTRVAAMDSQSFCSRLGDQSTRQLGVGVRVSLLRAIRPPRESGGTIQGRLPGTSPTVVTESRPTLPASMPPRDRNAECRRGQSDQVVPRSSTAVTVQADTSCPFRIDPCQAVHPDEQRATSGPTEHLREQSFRAPPDHEGTIEVH